MFPAEQEASIGHFNGVNQSNAREPPLPAGGAVVNLPLSLDPPPSYSIQSANHFAVSNAQSPYFVPPNALSQLAVESLRFHQTFLKGKPKALGIVLIVTAVLQIVLGIVQVILWANISVTSGITFWGPVFYIIAGSLSIAAETKPNPCMIRGALSLNIITSIVSGAAIILSCFDIFFMSLFHNCYNNYYEIGYYEKCFHQTEASLAIISLILVTDVLLFCVSVSLSAFGCRSLKHVSGVPQVLVIQNTVTLPVPSPTASPGFVPTMSTAFIQPPPPYLKNPNPGEPRIQTTS